MTKLELTGKLLIALNLLDEARDSVIGNRNRMMRDLDGAKGILATSALKDAIEKENKLLEEIDKLGAWERGKS